MRFSHGRSTITLPGLTLILNPGGARGSRVEVRLFRHIVMAQWGGQS